MRAPLLGLVLGAALAAAPPADAGMRDELDRAAESLEDARSGLRRANGNCRDALRANLDDGVRRIDGLGRRPTSQEVNQVQLFVAGIALAGALTSCPGRLLDDVNRSAAHLANAKTLADADALEDQGRRERRRRSRDDDDDDDRSRRRRDDRDRDDDDRHASRSRRFDPRDCWDYRGGNDYDPGCRSTRDGRGPMGRAAFDGLVASLRKTSSDLSKKDMTASLVRQQHLTSRQLEVVLGLFSSDLIKLDVVKACAPRLVDPHNGTGIATRFSSSLIAADAAQVVGQQRGDD